MDNRPESGSMVPAPVTEPAPAVAERPFPPAPRDGTEVPRSRRRLAWALAIAVDFVQIVAMPFFAVGAAAPWNDALDLLTGIAMVRLLGWHVAFVPTFVAELLPFVDLFPTWTAAVFFVSRRR